MAITKRYVDYDGPGGPFEGCLVSDGDSRPRPVVVIFPNVMGPKPFDEEQAERIVALGHTAFVADVYGKGRRTTDTDTAFGWMNEVAADRLLLRDRILAAIDAARAQDPVDAGRIAAIGYCFGGKCVLDLARSGAAVDGVASFHGVYDPPPFPNAARIGAKILVLHGWDDPLCPPDATVALAKELTDGAADWQIHAYGHTGHAFTHPGTAAMPGFGYQPASDARSWRALIDFLKELWG